MKDTFGSSVSVTVFGESHGEYVGAVLSGISPGLAIDYGFIRSQLKKRGPISNTDTARHEKDDFRIVSGVFNGKTTGTPICILIPNGDIASGDYEKNKDLLRPSHADYTSHIKYHGYEDYRGGGHFSGRVTAGIVAAGAIAISALKNTHINIATHILQCGKVRDRDFDSIEEEIPILTESVFPVLSDCKEKMEQEILKAKEENDSIGGITQTAVIGIPAGIGEPWFDSIESLISHAVFGIGGIKGIEFGKGFGFSVMRGSEANDLFVLENGEIRTETNNNGGINGGISNGMPIMFNCAVKPTPSISKLQKTVNITDKTESTVKTAGRHDPSIIRRICPVIDSVCAITLCDLLAQRFGTDVFLKGIKN